MPLNGTMTENGGSFGTRSEAGSVVLGLLQSLGIYLLGLTSFVVGATRPSGPPGGQGTLLEVVVVVSVFASGAAALWQGRRGRGRTATGAVVGTLAWPMIIYFLLAWAFVQALTHANIPF
jgi:hypothetical protein